MLRAFKSKKTKHKDIIFLYDNKKKEYIGKIYRIEDQEKIVKAFVNAYNNMNKSTSKEEKIVCCSMAECGIDISISEAIRTDECDPNSTYTCRECYEKDDQDRRRIKKGNRD